MRHRKQEKTEGLICAVNAEGVIQKGSLAFRSSEWTKDAFPEYTVLDLGDTRFPENFSEDDYLIVNGKLKKKSSKDRWCLKILGDNTITVLEDKEYTVQKFDDEGGVISEGKEEIKIRVTRGKLTILPLTLTEGKAVFRLKAIDETVSSTIEVTSPDRECIRSLKRVEFVA